MFQDNSVNARAELSTNYVPTFIEDIVVSPSVRLVCGTNTECIADASLTGVTSVGLSTLDSSQNQQNNARIAGKRLAFIYE